MTDKVVLKRSPTSGTRRGNGAGKGPGQGDGWGGPARHGAVSNATVHEPFAEANKAASLADMTPERLSKRELRRQRTERLEQILFDQAENAEREETRQSAAVRLHAIYNGTPVTRNVNFDADSISELTDAEIASQLQVIGRELFGATAGAAEADEGKPH